MQFATFAKTHVDWRWEFLSGCLSSVLPLLPVLEANYSLQKMGDSERSKLNSSLLANVESALRLQGLFNCYAHMFLAAAQVIKHYCDILEGCFCHADMWRTHHSYRN